MGIGVSVFLLAAGAILAFAVDMPANGLDIGALGVILMLVGGAGLLAAMVLWNDWHPGRRREVDLYDGLDEPDVVIDRRSPVVYDEPVVYEEPAAYEKPVAERRRVTSRRIIYDR
jgi:hypothetical protein